MVLIDLYNAFSREGYNPKMCIGEFSVDGIGFFTYSDVRGLVLRSRSTILYGISKEVLLGDRVADKLVCLSRKCRILEERLIVMYFNNYFYRFIPSASISHLSGNISNDCISFYDYILMLDPLGDMLSINATYYFDSGNMSFVLIDEDSRPISFKNFEDLYKEIKKRLEF